MKSCIYYSDELLQYMRGSDRLCFILHKRAHDRMVTESSSLRMTAISAVPMEQDGHSTKILEYCRKLQVKRDSEVEQSGLFDAKPIMNVCHMATFINRPPQTEV